MSKVSDEQVKAAADAIRNYWGGTYTTIARAALEAASSIHEAKPIAWRFQAEGCAKDCWHFAASDPTDLGMINISPLYPRPANFAGWKARLHDLTVELALIPSASKALDNAQAIVDELLEGFDDVVETEAALAGEADGPPASL